MSWTNVTQMLPFLILGALGLATLIVALGARRSARRAEEVGEGRFELLREQGDRLELLREERKTLLEELELERQERSAAQERVKQLTREHPHLELEREIRRVTEELELEREARLHHHRERQRLAEELVVERLARSEDRGVARREVASLEREVERLVEELERQGSSKASNGFWGDLFGGKSR